MKTYRDLRNEMDVLTEMANLTPERTGLPFAVWICSRSRAQHDIRVKVYAGPKATGEPVASVAIRPTVRVMEGDMPNSDLYLLRRWIEANRDLLIRYWNGEITDTKWLAANIHRVGNRPIHEEMDDTIDPVFEDDAESGYYFTDIQRQYTGLPLVVWIAVCAGVSHDIRIWLHPDPRSLPTERTCLAIRPDVRVLKGNALEANELELIRRFVGRNLDTIQKHWDGELDSGEAIDAIRPI